MSEVIVLTGAAGGIGQAISHQLIAQDVQLVIVDRDEAKLHNLAQSLGPKAWGMHTDLCNPRAVEQLMESIQTRFGRIDTLINNAAVVITGSVANREPALIEQEIQINLIAPLVLTRLAIPLLRKASRGHVINTVSVAGVFPTPESAIYSASKFGLRGAMLSMALDLQMQGVLISNVMPSATDTAMLRHEAVHGGNVLQFMDPPQQPADVARTILKVMKKPRLETAPRPSELWLTKIAMLFPNLLPVVLPLFKRKGERGLQRYLKKLESEGLARRDQNGWKLKEDHHV